MATTKCYVLQTFISYKLKFQMLFFGLITADEDKDFDSHIKNLIYCF